MELPGHLHALAAETIGIETDGAHKRRLWAVVLGLMPYRDGDRWCVSTSTDLQSAVYGFGNTPDAAIWDFEQAMYGKGGTPL